jgi:hypothetical protein
MSNPSGGETSRTGGVYQRPVASLREINDVMGRRSTPSGDIAGMSLTKVACDDLVARQTLTVLGRVVARLTCMQGSASAPSIAFDSLTAASGLYGNSGAISVAVGGANVCTFDASGASLAALRGISGTIDFGGSTLINVAGIVINPGSYELVGNPVLTVDATTTVVALVIPVVARDVSKNSIMEVSVKALAVVCHTDGATNGVYDFRARIVLEVGDTMPIVSAKYEISNYCSGGLAGADVVLTPVDGRVDVTVTGVAASDVTWQVKAQVVRVDSD